MSPAIPPPALKPAPETRTLEMVTVELPLLVTITLWTLLVDTLTLPKLT